MYKFPTELTESGCLSIYNHWKDNQDSGRVRSSDERDVDFDITFESVEATLARSAVAPSDNVRINLVFRASLITMAKLLRTKKH